MSKPLDRFQAAFVDALRDALSPARMKEFGKATADMIKLRTRLGSGVAAPGAEKAPLKPLAAETKERRKEMRKAGKLNPHTTPGKSNLTMSGQMLDSMTAITSGPGTVTVGPDGTRSDGRKKELTNAEVAEFVAKQGRNFNTLSKVEVKRVGDLISKAIREAMKRKLTKG